MNGSDTAVAKTMVLSEQHTGAMHMQHTSVHSVVLMMQATDA